MKECLRVLSSKGESDEVELAAADAAKRLTDFVEVEAQNDDRGSDIVAALKGVSVLLEAVLNTKEKNGLIQALMGACAGVFPPRKLESLRCLIAISRVSRHRAPIAGSGLLGVVSAAAVSDRASPSLRAMTFEAIGLLASDDPGDHDPATSRDPVRAAEFAKLRQQILQVGAVDAMVSCLTPPPTQLEGSPLAVSSSPQSKGGSGGGIGDAEEVRGYQASTIRSTEDHVSVCIAAAAALAALAPSPDVTVHLIRSNAVKKCLHLLGHRYHLSRSTRHGAEGAQAADREDQNEEEYDDVNGFDWCFSCERPALRVLGGILQPPLPVTSTTDAHDEHSQSRSSLIERIATAEAVDLLRGCLATRGPDCIASSVHVAEARRMALTTLKLLMQRYPGPMTTPISNSNLSADSSGQSAGGGSSDAKDSEAPSIAAYLLPHHEAARSSEASGREDRAGRTGAGEEQEEGLLDMARRVLTVGDYAAHALVAELLLVLCERQASSRSAEENAARLAVAEQWRWSLLGCHGGLLFKQLLRRATDEFDGNAGSGPPSSLSAHHPLLIATASLLRELRPLSASSSSSIDVPTSHSLPSKHLSASVIDSLTDMLASPRSVVRIAALQGVAVILVTSSPSSSFRRACIEHLEDATGISSSRPQPSLEGPVASLLPARLRTTILSCDMKAENRTTALEVLTAVDDALAHISGQLGVGKFHRAKGNADDDDDLHRLLSGILGVEACEVSGSESLDNRSNVRVATSRSDSSSSPLYSTNILNGNCGMLLKDELKLAALTYAADPEALKMMGNARFGIRLLVDAIGYYATTLIVLDKALTPEQRCEQDRRRGAMEPYASASIGVEEPSGVKEPFEPLEPIESLKLRVACHLNIARCFLKLGAEHRCLKACTAAEVTAMVGGYLEQSKETRRVAKFLAAQLFWNLASYSHGAGFGVSYASMTSPAMSQVQRQYLRRARDILKDLLASVDCSDDTKDRSAKLLLRQVQAALKRK